MRKSVLLFLFVSLLLSCQSSSDKIQEYESRADETLQQMSHFLAEQDMDSLRLATIGKEDVEYFIFNGLELVYWSDSRLDLTSIDWNKSDEWHTATWGNASVRYKWKRWGGLRLMAVVIERWSDYDTLGDTKYRPTMKVNIYFIIILLLFIGLITWGVVGVLQAHGFSNMRLQTKFQYLVISLFLLAFLYIFSMLVVYVRKHYERHQVTLLQDKCRYIRQSLQGMDDDLLSLSVLYQVPVHIYDYNGQLVASSSFEVSEIDILSTRLSPQVLFADHRLSADTVLLVKEQMGRLRSLTAYTSIVSADNLKQGYLAVPYILSEDEMAREVDSFLSRLLPAYIVVLVLAICLSIFIARTLVQPIRLLSAKMKSYRYGNPNNHIRYDNKDEIGELADHYNDMVDSLDEAFLRLAQSERDSAWRTMARQIAHEINNPLTPMKLTIQQLQRTKGTDRFDEYFAKSTRTLLEQMDTLSRIASSFSTFAKMPEVRVSEVDVAQKLTAAIALFAHNEQNIPIRYIGPNEHVVAWADREQIVEVFTNILKNALQALEGNKNGDIIVILQDTEQEVVITISDNGPGISPEIKDRIFLPNFTTKSTGTGLGLAITKNIVEGSGGNISFETGEKGTKFFVRLKKSRNFARQYAQKA